MENKVEPTRPFYLRNHNSRDWTEPLDKTEASEKLFTENELIDLLSNTIKRKTLMVIRSNLSLT